MLFVCKVELADGKIVELEPVEEKSLESAKCYFENYLDYWSKVWYGWRCSKIVSVEKIKFNDKC